MKSIRNDQILIWLMGFSTLPFIYLFTKVDYTDSPFFWMNIASACANILGFIASFCFFWQILIGTRHFTKYLTSNTVWVNKLHRNLGIYGIIFILAHPLLEAYVYLKSIPWLFTFSFKSEFDTHISFGRIALILFLVIWITSAVLRGRIKFKPWKYIHYLSYPLMGFVFIHAFEIGTFLQTVPAIRILWGSMLLIYLVLIVIRLSIGGGFLKKVYRIISIEHVGDSIILLKVKPNHKPIRTPRIGQYVYLQIRRFHEAHPFTIMEYDKTTHELTFGIRKIGNFTHTLETLQLNTPLFVDGPYGTFTAEAQTETERVVIAGGIGVTPFVELAKTYGKNLTFIHCNRTERDIVYRNQIKMAADHYIDVLDGITDSTDPSVLTGKLDLDKIKFILKDKEISKLPFFICGSPMFIKTMKRTLLKAGIPKQHLYSEELGFL